MESGFWFVFGILTGIAALPWLRRLADRARRTLAELELDDPLEPHAAPDDEQDRR